MNRTEFIALTAVILFVAFVLGWFGHWLVHRFVRVKGSDMNELDSMAQQLHDAEEQRDQAVDYYQKRESQLTNNLHQTEAELRAAMEGLRDARQEAEELRAYIERMNQPAETAEGGAPVFRRG
ncbi:hypothetical protein [Pseudoruegeria sp. HB172150]|uniref:hypothetical protein n=1 Tax=Pseudoruegeria sp. HB172150 TaxID=2721164 RepID=UPI001557953D|nr:hypothetical protein [Pseudoruegeria sp. HB172150]